MLNTDRVKTFWIKNLYIKEKFVKMRSEQKKLHVFFSLASVTFYVIPGNYLMVNLFAVSITGDICLFQTQGPQAECCPARDYMWPASTQKCALCSCKQKFAVSLIKSSHIGCILLRSLRDVVLTKRCGNVPKKLVILKQFQTHFNAKHWKGVGTPFQRDPSHYTLRYL